MPHKRGLRSLEKREARWLAVRTAYWDRERKEAIALEDLEVIKVVRGEVLYDRRGFLSPSLKVD